MNIWRPTSPEIEYMIKILKKIAEVSFICGIGILYIHITSTIFGPSCKWSGDCGVYGDEISDYGYVPIFIIVGIFGVYFELTRDKD